MLKLFFATALFCLFSSQLTAQDTPNPLTELDASMVLVKGGSFQMGCKDGSPDCQSDAKPYHRVTVSDFLMSKYEVTQALWEAVMGENPSRHQNCPQCPVENVTWTEVQEFIFNLSIATGKWYRLPTEAEWEYAARGGQKAAQQRRMGLQLEDMAWYGENADGHTHRVGQKTPNILGLYDMQGNVYEWCSDWHAETYPTNDSKDPRGSMTGFMRIHRGGGYIHKPKYCHVYDRGSETPYSGASYGGLRLVRRP